jgi:hypothetical protein
LQEDAIVLAEARPVGMFLQVRPPAARVLNPDRHPKVIER